MKQDSRQMKRLEPANETRFEFHFYMRVCLFLSHLGARCQRTRNVFGIHNLWFCCRFYGTFGYRRTDSSVQIRSGRLHLFNLQGNRRHWKSIMIPYGRPTKTFYRNRKRECERDPRHRFSVHSSSPFSSSS